MVFEERPSPARVSAAAAAKLPRAVLLALIVAYIVGGLFGRDVWLEDDATGFGAMWTMAHGGLYDWLAPNVLGQRVLADGPLAFWAGAASIAVFGRVLGDVAAARLPEMLWFFAATAALWYATFRLARRDEAQPVAFAFGGEATARDYGRMLADLAVLLLLGTIGPIEILHQTTSEPAALALSFVTAYGLVLSLDRPHGGALLSGVGLGLLLLARGPQPALWLALAALPLLARTAPWLARLRGLLAMTLAATAVFGLWPLVMLAVMGDAGRDFLVGWFAAQAGEIALPGTGVPLRLLRDLTWYAWPLWPLAAWAVYAWRLDLRRPHVVIGATLLVFTFLGLMTSRSPSVTDLTFMIVPLALLAPFGAVSLRRPAEYAIEWFGITAFCLFTMAVWAYFIALHTGYPPAMHRSILRQTAGYVPPLDWAQASIAVLATATWIALVAWRMREPSSALWRGPMLSATGLVTLWIAFSSLFLAAVDHRRSFAPLAREVAAQVAGQQAPGACVLPSHLRPSHLAVFSYYGKIRFSADDRRDCAFALQRDLAGSLLDDTLPPGRWSEIWQGHRPAISDELFRLYRRRED